LGALLFLGVASASLWFNAPEQSALTWPAALFIEISMCLAAVLTVFYFCIVVAGWFRKRANANR